MSKKDLIPKVYRISDQKIFNKLPGNYIKDFINEFNDKNTDSHYINVPCHKKDTDFTLKLYIQKQKPHSKPSWYNFLIELTDSHQDIKELRSSQPSYILFIYSKDEIFSICGGHGSKALRPEIDNQFGFNVIERLIDEKTDIRNIYQKGFLGIELASDRYFKSNYTLANQDSFGKYLEGIQMFIDKSRLKSIGLITDNKNLLVRGEKGFKIDMKIDFNELLLRIKLISKLINDPTPPKVELNPFRKLNKHNLAQTYSGKPLSEILFSNLCQNIWEEIKTKNSKEIFHPELREYLSSSQIFFKMGRKECTVSTAIKITVPAILRKLEIYDDSLNPARISVLLKKITSTIVNTETGRHEYTAKLSDWLFGEVRVGGRRYIKFDYNWYEYSEKFEQSLNERLNLFFNKIELESLPKWTSDYHNEAQYNDQVFANKTNVIVGDKVYYLNIEIADILKWTDDELFVYHVKRGIDKDLRVLQSQIKNSCSIISLFKENIYGKEIETYYNNLVRNERIMQSGIKLQDFRLLFSERKINIVFCVATKSKNSNAHNIIKEIEKSRSSIAKIAILDSYYTSNRFDLDFNFKFAKIIVED